MESLCILPPEVICHVLCFLRPRDVVQLRRISKQFHGLTYDLAIWRTLYTKARLPRPPGPFPSQSFQFLERTLVQSERLAHSWTTQPMRDISSIVIPTPESLSILPIILHGKWLVGCESSIKFVVYDLDSNARSHPHQLLWESTSPIDAWDVNSSVSTSGLLIHVVFRIATDEPFSPWKLLEFCVNGDSLYHTLTLDVPTKKTNNIEYIEGGRSSFLYIHHQRLIFDAETRSFYEFPEFQSELINVSSHSYASNGILRVILLTKTHIIALFHHTERTVPHMILSTLIQAFTVHSDPRLVHNGTGVLRLSHEGVTPRHIESLDLIRNSIVDAASGATSIRFLHQFLEGDDLHFSCIDLSLPKHSSTDTILPMTIELNDIAHVHHGPFGLYPGRMHYIESSDDGHVRGFWRFAMPHGPPGDFRPFPIMRFTIDASQDRCVAVLGQISLPDWMQIHDPPWSRGIFFDGVRGRMYYNKIRYILGVDDEAAVVISMK